MSNDKYVGMDVHKAITVIVVLNALGHMESHSKVKTKAENICDFFRGLSGKVEVVDEAMRFRAESLLDQLAALQELRKQAKRRFVLRVRQHPDYRILSGLPGLKELHDHAAAPPI